jgi:hypothetical protein
MKERSMKRATAFAFLAGFAITGNGDAPAQGYVNVFAGMAVFDSTVTVGGVKLVDHGGDAAMAGARIGWGHRFPAGLYLGAEAELFGASGRSRAVVNGQAYSHELRGGAGGFGRIGFAPGDGRALFFVRGGAQALFTSRGTEWVPAVGAGAEIPFAGRWFARVDVTYAWNGIETYQGTVGVGRRF